MPRSAFQVEVRVSIRRVEYDEADTERRAPRWTNETLSVDESMELNISSFAEVAKVLGQFHDLGNEIRERAYEEAT